MGNNENWVWTELIAFDNREHDFGAKKYCDLLGFVPAGLCLLVSAPDFVFLHDGLAVEKIMSPLICSRDAHEGNEERKRQEWTNWQIRALVASLSRLGCPVYLSMFSVYYQNRHHHEWLSDHQEALGVWVSIGRGLNFNPLAQLKDGTLLEDIFIPKTVQACVDYGFAGWHGPDGYGPLVTSLWGTDMSDQMVAQFRQFAPDLVLPDFMLSAANDDRAVLAQRAGWLREHQPGQWIAFYVERWTRFWRKMTAALHRDNKRSIINSAWCKGNFEALYNYGINYQKMAATGIDYMVVETVALGLSQSRPHLTKHYDFAATLFEIKAFAPDCKLLFLHGIKDVVESWDNLRHATPGYERELYTLANMYYRSPDQLGRAATGLLACLGDGISAEEWRYIRRRWDVAFAEHPIKVGQVTAVWSDELLSGGVDDYVADGMWSSHWQIAKFMEHNVQIQSSVQLDQVACSNGAVYLPSAHLLAESKLNRLLQASTRPVILSGRAGKLAAYFPRAHVVSDGTFAVLVCPPNGTGSMTRVACGTKPFVPNPVAPEFTEDLNRLDLADELFQKAAALINQVVTADLREHHELYAECPDIKNGDGTVNSCLIDAETIDVAVENTTPWGRLIKTIRVSKPIASVDIISSFPLRILRMIDDCSFALVVPLRGASVARVKVMP